MNENWYETPESRSGWYDALPRTERSVSAATPSPAKPRKKWPRILMIVVLAAAIAAGVLYWALRPPVVVPETADAPSENGHADEDLQLPEDFQDFFADYYTPINEVAECTIPKVDTYPGILLPVQPRGTEELNYSEIYEKCLPSVVGIYAYVEEDSSDSYFWGTGIVLAEDGYLVTNSHIVEGACRAEVALWNDEIYEAKLVGNDARNDIAILKIEAHGLVPAEFCEDECTVGEGVVAIGNPLQELFRGTMTEGIISGIDRDMSYNGATLTLLQISAPINSGNSGGPLINMYGQVIGITNMKMSTRYMGSATIEGLGFAIPIRTVKVTADSILAHAKYLGRPALGITIGPIPDTAREVYDLPEGLYVSAVSENSDCAAKGIQVGDILLSVDGESVTATAQVSAHLQNVGDELELTLWREGETYTVTVRVMDVVEVY